MGVYCQKFPHEAPALMKYGEVVRYLAACGHNWKMYDENFRFLRQSQPTSLKKKKKSKKSKVVHIYSALITRSQRHFTVIKLPPVDWKHIQAQIAAASKQSMHAGTHFTDLGRIES